MRRNLLFATLTSVALVSCVNDEISDVNQVVKQKITFESPAMFNNSETRANVYGEMKNPYDIAEYFKVFAVQHDGMFNKWSSGDNLWNGGNDESIEVRYNTTLDGWEPYLGETPIEENWPYQKRVTFAAYSPSDLGPQTATGYNLDYDDNGLKIENYTIPNTNQYDLMFSERSYSRTTSNHLSADGEYKGVPIRFKHALSSIHFALTSDQSNVTLTKIQLKVEHTVGTFNENIGNLETGLLSSNIVYGSDPKWTYPATAVNGTFTAFDVTKTNKSGTPLEAIHFPVGNMLTIDEILQTEEATYNGPHGVFAIPQLISNAKLVLSYKVGDTQINEREIDISTTFQGEWKMGTRYIYILSIGTSTGKIYFAPSIEAWKQKDDTVILPLS